jgi:hypothetical protein
VGNDVTRYLCAAAQTDVAFNARLLALLRDRHRAVAHSPGVDLGTVLRYGLAAERRQRGRDVALAVLLIAAVVVVPTRQPVPLAVVILTAWGIVYGEQLWTYYRVLAPHLRREVFDPAGAPQPADRYTAARLADVEQRARGNVTVFPGYRPFLGFGPTFRTWSLELNVAVPEEGKTLRPFDVHELYAHLAHALERLGLPGTTVEHRLFVNGDDLLTHLDRHELRRALLPVETAPPAAHADAPVLRRLAEDPHGRARPYLAVGITGWGGELVATLFLRFALLPARDLLFVEVTGSLLAPVRERYRLVDRLRSQPTARQIVKLAPGPLRTLEVVFGSLPRLLSTLFGPLNDASRERAESRRIEDRVFNYGAPYSPREAAGDHRYYRYFQELDVEMYAGLAERRILDALVTFLSDHGVDVSDFKEQRTTILNNGVFVSGQGTVNAGSIAAGSGSRASNVSRLAGGGAGQWGGGPR